MASYICRGFRSGELGGAGPFLDADTKERHRAGDFSKLEPKPCQKLF